MSRPPTGVRAVDHHAAYQVAQVPLVRNYVGSWGLVEAHRRVRVQRSQLVNHGCCCLQDWLLQEGGRRPFYVSCRRFGDGLGPIGLARVCAVISSRGMLHQDLGGSEKMGRRRCYAPHQDSAPTYHPR